MQDKTYETFYKQVHWLFKVKTFEFWPSDFGLQVIVFNVYLYGLRNAY